MSSVTSTGTCFCPLCTPNVSPTNCGNTVERRLQILMTALVPLARAVSAFFSRYPSTNGPFQTDRDTDSLPSVSSSGDGYAGCVYPTSCLTWFVCPWSACPTASQDDDRQRCVLHHHHAGDRPGSWRHHEPPD